MTDILAELLNVAGKESDVPIPDGPVLDFTVEKQKFVRAMNAVSSVVHSKNLIPSLTNFHFTLDGLVMKVAGSDSTISALSTGAVLTSTGLNGSVLLPSRVLTAASEASDYAIHIKVVRKKKNLLITLKSGATTWTIPLPDPTGTFPDLTPHTKVQTSPVDRTDFLSALQRVRKAASNDATRPYLMLVDLSKGKMRASDSIRFQQVKYAFPFECQIPTRLAHEVVQRLTASDEEEIQVGETQNALIFWIGDALIAGQKATAAFPDVDEILLKPVLSNDQLLKVSRKNLLDAVRRVRISADETTSAVVLSLNHGSVSVEAKDRRNNAEVAVESIEAEWEHSPRHISFNHKHLTDLLSSSQSDTCVFRLGKDLKTKPSPLLMEDDDEGFTAVLSQIRLDWM